MVLSPRTGSAQVRESFVYCRARRCQPVTSAACSPMFGRRPVSRRARYSSSFSCCTVLFVASRCAVQCCGPGSNQTGCDKRVEIKYYKTRGKKLGWLNRRRLDDKCAPNMPHEPRKPVCDSCYLMMQRLIQGTPHRTNTGLARIFLSHSPLLRGAASCARRPASSCPRTCTSPLPQCRCTRPFLPLRRRG